MSAQKKNKTVECIISALDVFFNGNFKKTDLWLRTKNPLLGNVRPWDMIEAGREKKLLKFINNQLSQNPPKAEGKL